MQALKASSLIMIWSLGISECERQQRNTMKLSTGVEKSKCEPTSQLLQRFLELRPGNSVEHSEKTFFTPREALLSPNPNIFSPAL